ncbi:MAG: NAD(P)-dependent alcohol dehydrogenase [Ilumatobacteraceae bacterium]
MKTMRAVVHDRYGSPEVLRLEEVEQPVPKDDEVLIKIHATTVNRSDCGWRGGVPFFSRFFTGVRRPRRKILGSEFAGEIAAVGSSVDNFVVGDQVFGACGFGAHAEYVCMRANRLIAHKPKAMSFQEAAAVCDGFVIGGTCLTAADLRPGRTILIYGASGAIGTAAVQLARNTGAHVTAVCDTKHVDLVKSLGADEVIDYTKDDFTRTGQRYDVVLDAVGKNSFRRCRRAIVRGGTYIETDLGFMWHVPPLALLTRLTHRLGGRRVTMPIPKYAPDEIDVLKALIDAGKYRAVIDSERPLEQIVEATKFVETGQKTGNLVITVVKQGDMS